MLAFTLCNNWKHRWPTAPIRILARHNGVYRLPILVYGLDFRFEDNKGCDLTKVVRLGSRWIAKHPLDDYYIIGMDGVVEATHATKQLIHVLQRDGQLPLDLYQLPDTGEYAWWEWSVGFDLNNTIIKAPKTPRSTDRTPDEVDEAIEPQPIDISPIAYKINQEVNQIVSNSVKTRAYYLWWKAGCPRGHDWDFWTRAELDYAC